MPVSLPETPTRSMVACPQCSGCRIMTFEIDTGFFESCSELGRLPAAHVLLMDNAAIPWLLLIPETDEVELCDLPLSRHDQILGQVRLLSLCLHRHFDIDKINIACNGNLIRQMHLHIIGRRFDDYCWPDVVFGKPSPRRYAKEEIDELGATLAADPVLAEQGYRSLTDSG